MTTIAQPQPRQIKRSHVVAAILVIFIAAVAWVALTALEPRVERQVWTLEEGLGATRIYSIEELPSGARAYYQEVVALGPQSNGEPCTVVGLVRETEPSGFFKRSANRILPGSINERLGLDYQRYSAAIRCGD